MRHQHFNQFKYLPFLLLMLLSLPGRVFSQANQGMIDQLALPLNRMSQNNGREQVYIQLSKGIYELGEDLWFKSYLLNALSFSPGTLSKTLYVRGIKAGSKKPFWQERYEIVNGSVAGHVYLPDTLKEGNYQLEAFAKASFFKEDAEFKAFRRFTVVRDYKSLGAASIYSKKEAVNSSQKIQFGIFPEGGKLISGVPGKFAFKAVDIGGMPVDVSGTLLENGKVLQEFKSIHAGMGSLIFTPFAGRKYSLQLKSAVMDSTIELSGPDTLGTGLYLSSRDTSNLEFRIARASGFPETKVYLRGQIRGKTCFLASAMLGKDLKITVPLKNFAYQGIAEFTVFDEQFKPLAERLVYVHLQRKLQIKALLSKAAYGRREKATLNIQTTDEKGNPVSAELGISVYDKLYGNAGDPVNLLTYNFLSTQLKGRIYDLAFYFNDKNKGNEEALDLLLLTQGWRNYVWNEENLKAEGLKKALIFDETFGTVKFTKRLKQAPPGQLVNTFLSDEKGKPKNSAMIIPDAIGRFWVEAATLKAGIAANIYLKPTGPKEFEPRIKLNDPFLTIDTIAGTKRYSYPDQGSVEKPAAQSGLAAAMDSRVFRLQEVSIKGTGTQTFRDKYLGKLDSLAKIDPSGAFVCKHGQLNGFLQGFYCRLGGNGDLCTDTLTASPVEGRSYPLRRYEPSNRSGVWGLKEMTDANYHNPNNGMTEEEILKLNNISKLSGYYAEKEFYQPDYDKELQEGGLPDARNTLLWSPTVVTNEKGEASLSFFCSDINSAFIIQAEGLTKGGLLGVQKLEFIVTKGKPVVGNK